MLSKRLDQLYILYVLERVKSTYAYAYAFELTRFELTSRGDQESNVRRTVRRNQSVSETANSNSKLELEIFLSDTKRSLGSGQCILE